jgi:uncharacterized protein (TIGR00297 family)
MIMDFFTLDVGGIVLAILLGALFIVFGLYLGYFFLLSMMAFLVLSALVTWIGFRRKRRLGIGQSPRGVKNVLANGIPPLILVVIFYVLIKNGNSYLAPFAVIGFLASVAAITADKFGSEIGVLNGMPYMIFTMKKVRKGTSGGITALGIISGLVASLIIAILIIPVAKTLGLYSGLYHFSVAAVILGVTIAGLAGNLIDSALGYYEEKGIGNKFSSNFICSVIAGIITMGLFMLL